MAENTKIEWATHTWNPWIGCTKVGPPCDHCYAAELMDTRYGRVTWGAGEDRVKTAPGNWKLPYRWDRAAFSAGRRATVFCLSLGDIWDNEVDPLWRHQAFDVMRATPNLIYLLLSKRIGNAERMCNVSRHGSSAPLPPNAALGATMADDQEWHRDTEKLHEAGEALGALFTFASVEPMLGPIRIGDSYCPDWVICGGESGHGWRDMPAEWAESLRDQVTERGKAFFMKQMANKAPIPPHLMLRQFPEAIAA
jgi:protein gp37